MKKMNLNRPLGTYEKIFYTIDQHGSMDFVLVAEMEGTVPEETWRAAIDLVQTRYAHFKPSVTAD